MTKQSGIYGIRNLQTGEWYIGASTDLMHRKRNQLTALKSGKKSNRLLQAAYNKYGKENFVFVILEYALINKLDERERALIAHYKSNQEGYGYNIARGGSQGNPVRRTIRAERKKINRSFESHRNGIIGRSAMRKPLSYSQKR